MSVSTEHRVVSNGNGVGNSLPRRHSKTKDPVNPSRRSWLQYARYVRREHAPAVEEDARAPYAIYLQGLRLLDLGRAGAALERFQVANRLHPADPHTVKHIAACLLAQGRVSLAREAYEAAEKLRAQPDWEIYYGMALCASDNAASARQAQAAARAGGAEAAHALLARRLLAAGDTQGAMDAYEAAMKSGRCGPSTLCAAGVLRLRAGETRAAYQLLAAAAPAHRPALLALAAMLQEHGEQEAALARYRASACDSPAQWNNVGLAFLAKGKIVAAISCVQRCRWWRPLSACAAHNLALCLLRARRPASALAALSAAAALRPAHAPTLYLLAVSLEQLGEQAGALAAHARAAAAAPTSARARIRHGVALLAAGRKKAARDQLAIAKDILVQQDIVPTQVMKEVADLQAQLGDEDQMEEDEV